MEGGVSDIINPAVSGILFIFSSRPALFYFVFLSMIVSLVKTQPAPDSSTDTHDKWETVSK